jgi:hypothetical protein
MLTERDADLRMPSSYERPPLAQYSKKRSA